MVESIKSKEAFDLLKEDQNAVLIDVRTKKEHLAVGIPDLRELGKETFVVEWKNTIIPGSRRRFLNDFKKKLNFDQEVKHIFICRSGIRSNFAALTVEESYNSGNDVIRFFNIADGFEGSTASQEMYNKINGWKFVGLPWKKPE